MNTQQPAQSQAMQQTEAVQAAMQAARNQQVNGGRLGATNPNLQNEQQNQNQAMNAAGANNMLPNQNAQGPPIKTEGATGGGPPHVNTALATAPHIQQMQNRQPGAQNSPQSAIPQSATSVGPPKPLTHSDAVAHAARTYSSSQAAGQGSVMASHSHPPSLPRDAPNIKTNLMPIPKVLPPRATESPHPMQMPPSRPTYSGGPSGSGSGLMQQPVMQKAPGFNVEGDAERVLNKRKLDELIRQVTGGGEGLDNSEGLTPEVEDVSDAFTPFITSLLPDLLLYPHPPPDLP
jgi:transcription initiation factor TFIID subunit 12